MGSPYAVAPNRVLLTTNTFAVDLGSPVLASANRIVTSTNMKVGSYTIANASSADSLARNVTVTTVAVTGADTMGTVTVTGTSVTDAVITEDIVPVSGGTAAGLKAFKTVTNVSGAGWVINTGNDTITVGFGTKIGLPHAIDVGPAPFSTAAEIVTCFLGGVAVAPNTTYSGSDVSLDTIDASAGTYDGTKRLFALLLRA